jgi:hypothetical protein
MFANKPPEQTRENFIKGASKDLNRKLELALDQAINLILTIMDIPMGTHTTTRMVMGMVMHTAMLCRSGIQSLMKIQDRTILPLVQLGGIDHPLIRCYQLKMH